jgi:hypothetical protein
MDRLYIHDTTRELRSELRRVDKAIRCIQALEHRTLLKNAIANLRSEIQEVDRAIAAQQPPHGSRSQRKLPAAGTLRLVRKTPL